MKKIIILLIVFLSACNSPPKIDGKPPFVVGEIVRHSSTHSSYYAQSSKSSNILHVAWYSKPMIVLPIGVYNINDTITVDIFKTKGE